MRIAIERSFSFVGSPAAREGSRARIVAAAGATLLLLTFAGAAGAITALERDRVIGGADIVYWSEGAWRQGGTPLPACATFPGGTSTGPGQPTDADSILCAALADAWSWTVTIPGGYTIAWGINDLPPGIEVCAQIFYFVGRPGQIFVEVDIARDWMTVSDEQGTILYSGSFSGFYPLRMSGVVLTEARRCALVRLIPEGACCAPDGSCQVTIEADCSTGDWREGVPCDPNPCPQPLGACCYPDGTCQHVLQADCPTGDWRVMVPCEPNPCPQPPPVGACCFLDGSCQVLTEAECGAAEGQWQGAATDCDPNPCPPPVPVEKRSWGQIKARYR